MRVAGRFLFAMLCMVLICGTIGAFSGGRVDFPGCEAAFHKPHHPSPAIETAPVTAAASSMGERIASPVTGFAPRVSFGTRVADHRTNRAIAPEPETSLDLRPPPRTFLA
jgi:hypothetical protein